MNVHIVSANPALQMNKTDNCGGMQTQKNPTFEIQVLERNTTNGFGQCYCIGVYGMMTDTL
jgi:hypothetical protein